MVFNEVRRLKAQLKSVGDRLKVGNINDMRMATNYKLIFKEINFIDSIILNNVKYMRDNDLLISFLQKVYKSLLDMGITVIKGNVQDINVQEELDGLNKAKDDYCDYRSLADKHRRYFDTEIKPVIDKYD